MTKNYRVKRGNNVSVMALEVHADGTLWTPGKYAMPLLDGKSAGCMALGKDKINELIKAKRYAEIPADCFARIGVSDSGLEVRSFDDIRAEAESAMTPAQKERREIEKLFQAAERRRNDADDDNEMDYYRLLHKAEKALEAWREKYPEEELREAALERISEYEGLADKESRLASGALVYDADGSIDAEEQQRRHDEHAAKAEYYKKQADDLRKYL